MAFFSFLFPPKLTKDEKKKLKNMERLKYLKMREKQIEEKYK